MTPPRSVRRRWRGDRRPVAHAQFEELYRFARAEGSLTSTARATAPFQTSGCQFLAAFPGITVNVTGGFSNELAPAIDAQIAAGQHGLRRHDPADLQDFERWKRGNALLPFQPVGFDRDSRRVQGRRRQECRHSRQRRGLCLQPRSRAPAASVPHAAHGLPRSPAGGAVHHLLPAGRRRHALPLRHARAEVRLGVHGPPDGEPCRSSSAGTSGWRGRSWRIGRACRSTRRSASDASEWQKNGAKIQVVSPTRTSPADRPQSAAIFRGAPHPNAAKLYLSWLLMAEEQGNSAGQSAGAADVAPPAGFRPSWIQRANDFRDFVNDGRASKSYAAATRSTSARFAASPSSR